MKTYYGTVDSVLREATPEEVAQIEKDIADGKIRLQNEIKEKRNLLLAESDWIVIKSFESNQNIPAAWEIYRQALRDIPQQAGFPDNVVWPEKP